MNELTSGYRTILLDDLRRRLRAAREQGRLKNAQEEEWRTEEVTIPELYLLLKVLEQAVGGEPIKNK